MGKPLIYLILIELHDRDAVNEDQIIINDFLNRIWRKGTDEDSNDLNRIKMALERLVAKGYITKSYNPSHHELNVIKADSQGKQYRCDLDDTDVQVGLTPSGYDYIIDALRKERQDAINETIKKNSTVQKNTARIVACFAGLTTLFSVITFFRACGTYKESSDLTIPKKSPINNNQDFKNSIDTLR
jgi:hypothetical protein